MVDRTKIVPVTLSDGTIIKVEVPLEQQGGEVSFEKLALKLEGFTKAVEGIVGSITETLKKVKPDKATVELGLNLAVEAGQLTALIAKGEGNASVKLILEWEKEQTAGSK